jgi:hypothetical protein
VQLYPEFPSASAFLETPESFGFVILFSKELGIALQQRLSSLPAEIKSKWRLTSDQKHLCKRINLELPFLPVDTPDEIKLFGRLAVEHFKSNGANKVLDFDQMAIDWCKSVDGITIFPKLPVYLKNYFPTMQARLFIADSSKEFAGKEKKLSQVMESTSSLIPTSTANLAFMKPSTASGGNHFIDSDSDSDSELNTAVGEGRYSSGKTSFFHVAEPSAKVPSRTDHSTALSVVNVLKLDCQPVPVQSGDPVKKRRKQFSRTCTYCRVTCNDPDRAKVCDGRTSGKTCPFKATATAVDDDAEMSS